MPLSLFVCTQSGCKKLKKRAYSKVTGLLVNKVTVCIKTGKQPRYMNECPLTSMKV